MMFIGKPQTTRFLYEERRIDRRHNLYHMKTNNDDTDTEFTNDKVIGFLRNVSGSRRRKTVGPIASLNDDLFGLKPNNNRLL